MKRKATRYLAFVALLAGCTTVGRDYSVPVDAIIRKPSALQEFQEMHNPAVRNAELPRQWWRLYSDPMLDELITRALQANTDLRVAAANVKRAEASLEMTKEKTLPKTELMAAPSYTRLSAEEYLLPGAPLPAEYLYGVEGSLSYQLDLFGEVTRAIHASRANTAASRAAYDRVKVDIIAETTRTYLEICSTNHEIEIITALDSLQHQLTTLQGVLVRAGRGTSTDMKRLKVQEAHTHAALPLWRARQKAALYRMAAFIGKTPAELPHNIEARHSIPSIDRPLPTGDGGSMIQRHPDIRQAEEELKAATAGIGVATASLYPHISLGVSGGSVGLAENFLRNDTFKFSIGPLISWEFPNRSHAKTRIKGAEAETEAAYARFDGSVLNALREVETALTVYAHDLDRNRELRHAEAETDRVEQDTEKLFKGGKANIITKLEARKALLQISLDRAESDAKVLEDQVQLFHALGGGW